MPDESEGGSPNAEDRADRNTTEDSDDEIGAKIGLTPGKTEASIGSKPLMKIIELLGQHLILVALLSAFLSILFYKVIQDQPDKIYLMRAFAGASFVSIICDILMKLFGVPRDRKKER